MSLGHTHTHKHTCMKPEGQKQKGATHLTLVAIINKVANLCCIHMAQFPCASEYVPTL